MKRTEYFDHTRPSATQLNNTETSKVNALLERMRACSQFGIVSGFIVSPNAGDQTKIDISGGEGYTSGFYSGENLRGAYSGERINTLPYSGASPGTATTATAESLADYTLNALNYVTLVYEETGSNPLSERYYPFASHNTIYTEGYTVSILTSAAWAALTSDEIANRILVAIVTANGPGVPLTSASIQQVVQPKTHPTFTQPTSITGVVITGISPYTLVGGATLRYEQATNKLYWTAPGDSEGVGVALPLTGGYTLNSGTTTYYITVDVVLTSIPVVDTSETITITALYGSTIPAFSAVDQAHRDMVGSGLPTVTNPHGLTVSDIGGGLENHADLFHVNAISKDADDNQLLCAISGVTGTDILVNNVGSERNSFLINGVTYESLTGVSAGATGQVAFATVPATDSGDYLVYIDESGYLQKVKIAGVVLPGGQHYVLWDSSIDIFDMLNTTAGNGVITWDDAEHTLTWEAPGDGAPGAAVNIMGVTPGGNPTGYYKLYSSDTTNWIIVRVTGALGAASSSTVAVAMTSTQAKDLILPLCVVTWNQTSIDLGNLRDVRAFQRVSADNKTQVDEEHDENGRHTKALQQQLRVAVSSNGIFAQAEENNAIVGHAVDSDYGVLGSAGRYYGVAGVASASAVYGSATEIAFFGTAPNTAAEFLAATDSAVYASAAETYGVIGRAGSAIGVSGSALVTAIYGLANNTAILATANSNYAGGTVTGVHVLASNPGAEAQAIAIVGSVAGASATGVYGLAPTGTGVFGSGGIVGVYGSCVTAFAGSGVAVGVDTAYGVRVNAANAINPNSAIAVSGAVAGVNATAIFGSAAAGTGVFGKATQYGLYGSASVVGVYGLAENTAILATANSNYAGGTVTGVHVLASNPGAEAQAIAVKASVAGLNATGVHALAAAGTAVYGQASVTAIEGSASNVGIFGLAATGTGVYGKASVTAVEGSASNVGVYGSAATASGIYGYAASTGVIGSAHDNVGVFATVNNVTNGMAVNVTGVYGVAGATPAAGSHVMGVVGKASNLANVSSATGVFGTVAADDATAVYGYADSGIGVFGYGNTLGVGVHARGGSRGMYASAWGNPAFAGEFVHSTAGGTAISATGSYLGAVISAGDNTRQAGIYGVSAVALNNTNDAASLAVGVYGSAYNYADGIDCVGVSGIAGVGVYGAGVPNLGIGVYGICSADNGNGVYGTGRSIGVQGYVTTAGATGVYGYHNASGRAVFGSAPNADGTGVFGEGITGVFGSANNAAGLAVYGVASSVGAYLKGTATGVYASASNGTGVYGSAATGTGIYGSGRTYGVYGSASAATAIYGSGDEGVAGGFVASGTDAGEGTAVYGYGQQMGCYATGIVVGVYGKGNTNGGNFYGGANKVGAYGEAAGTAGQGLYGTGGSNGAFGVGATGVFGSGADYGGNFAAVAIPAGFADLRVAHGNNVPAIHFAEEFASPGTFPTSWYKLVKVMVNNTVCFLPVV